MNESQTISKNDQFNWRLDAFYSSIKDEKINLDIQEILQKVDQFILNYKGKINGLNSQNWLNFFTDESQINHSISKVGLYLLFLSSLNTQDQIVLAKNSEFENIFLEIYNKLAFINQELKEIGRAKLLEIGSETKLIPYKNFFLSKANSLQYILEEKTEKALNLKEKTASIGWKNMYEELTNSFVFEIEINQEKKQLTEDELMSLRSHEDENIRKQAYISWRKVYNNPQNQIVLGNIYNCIVQDWTNEILLRGFGSVMESRNLEEQMENEVVETLIQEVRKSYSLYQRYLQVKAKLLNKEKLNNWDILAPIGKQNNSISLDKALEIYLQVAKKFDQELYDFSQEMISTGKLDLYPNTGKAGGGFCAYEKDFPSYILLNYTGTINDAIALAHEFGHAFHGHLSQRQPEQVFDSGLALAETASVFNQTLMIEALIRQASLEEKVDLLDKQLSEMFSYIFSSIRTTSFEKTVHEQILAGKQLRYTDFNQIWRNSQLEMTADLVQYDVLAEEESTWSAIPHIFRTPFYNYTYSFGNLLSLALYEQYEENGQNFVQNYKNILQSGGSKPPKELLLENGLDISKANFYQKGLKMVEKLVIEFENLK